MALACFCGLVCRLPEFNFDAVRLSVAKRGKRCLVAMFGLGKGGFGHKAASRVRSTLHSCHQGGDQ